MVFNDKSGTEKRASSRFKVDGSWFLIFCRFLIFLFLNTHCIFQVHAMLDFAEDLEECRKIKFAKFVLFFFLIFRRRFETDAFFSLFCFERYFSHSSNLSIASWSTEDQDALERCGHCDNCIRPPETIECKDVSLYSWQLLQIAHYIHKNRGKATVNMLAGLARTSGGAFDVSSGKKGGRKEKVTLALDDIAGGTVDLSRDVSYGL